MVMMNVMDLQDRRATLATLDRAAVDPEFLPYLDRLNVCPWLATQQCCIGHMKYEGQFSKSPEDGSGRWGYLSMMMSQQLATGLAKICDQWSWLWIPCSQLPIDGAVAPGMTKKGSVVLTFAWEAKHWPQPAEDLCGVIEEFYAAHRRRHPPRLGRRGRKHKK
jgi:hypothetical protein